MRFFRTDGRSPGSGRRLLSVALLALFVPLIAAAADRGAIEERFEVIDLSDRLLLRPHAGESLPQVEIPDAGDGALVRGQLHDAEALESELGDAAAAVAELAALPLAARREALGLPPREAEPEPSRPHHTRVKRSRSTADDRVVFGRSLVIEEEEVAGDAVCFGGRVEVRGRVTGDAVVIGGSVTVSGKVAGDVVAIGGQVLLREGARVEGDVVAVGGEAALETNTRVEGEVVSVGGTVHKDPGAEIVGKVSEVSFWRSPWSGRTGPTDTHGIERFKRSGGGGRLLARRLLGLVALGLLVGLVLLVAQPTTERVAARVVSESWSAGLTGLLVELLFLPLLLLVVLVLLITVIGIPLLLLIPVLLFALVLVALLGYAGVALAVGRWLCHRFGWEISGSYAQALLGVVAIQALTLLGALLGLVGSWVGGFGTLIALLGFLVRYLAWTVGLGAALLLLARRKRSGPEPLTALSTTSPAGELPPIPPAPVPPPADLGAASGPEPPAGE